MRKIPLTQNQYAIIDDADYDLIKPYKWQAAYKPSTDSFYAISSIRDEHGVIHTVRMHRLIANTPKGKQTDHRNQDTLDNRRENLRVCTPSQNNCNRKMHVHNYAGFKGVSFRWARGKWQARINLNGKRKFLGTFETAEEASIAYQKAAVQIHGEYARF